MTSTAPSSPHPPPPPPPPPPSLVKLRFRNPVNRFLFGTGCHYVYEGDPPSPTPKKSDSFATLSNGEDRTPFYSIPVDGEWHGLTPTASNVPFDKDRTETTWHTSQSWLHNAGRLGWKQNVWAYKIDVEFPGSWPSIHYGTGDIQLTITAWGDNMAAIGTAKPPAEQITFDFSPWLTNVIVAPIQFATSNWKSGVAIHQLTVRVIGNLIDQYVPKFTFWLTGTGWDSWSAGGQAWITMYGSITLTLDAVRVLPGQRDSGSI